MYAQALSEKSVGKYKKSLSTDEIGEIERLLESMGEAFKYWLPTVSSFPSCQFRGKKKQPTPRP